jgi:hypothetical protein
MKHSITLAIAGMIAMIGIASPAFAFRGGDAVNFAVIRHENQAPNKLKLVSIKGALSCDMGAENNGQGCSLKLRETGTNRTYNLIEADNAMRLFQDGSKSVVIEGRMADAETIEVKNARTL